MVNRSKPNNRPVQPTAWQPADSVIDAALLDLLLRSKEPIRVETLAIRLNTTTQRVLAELERLRGAGCRLQTHPQQGVRLTSSGLTSWTDYLRRPEGPSRDRIVEVYAQTSSTQDAARRLVTCCGRSADGAVVIADLQTAGRGRLGRRWIAPPGSAVTFTRICLLESARTSVDRLTLATTVALAEAIGPLVHAAAVQIKWPNDLLVDGRKVAGTLIETFPLPERSGRIAALIGVGVNVTVDPQDLPPECHNRVTSLRAAGMDSDRLRVLDDTLWCLDRTLGQQDPTALLDPWRAHCPMISKRVRLRSGDQPLAGQVIDLDPMDGLIVRTDTGSVVHLPAATTTIL